MLFVENCWSFPLPVTRGNTQRAQTRIATWMTAWRLQVPLQRRCEDVLYREALLLHQSQSVFSPLSMACMQYAFAISDRGFATTFDHKLGTYTLLCGLFADTSGTQWEAFPVVRETFLHRAQRAGSEWHNNVLSTADGHNEARTLGKRH